MAVSPYNQQIEHHLHLLRLPGILREWRKVTEEAEKESIPYRAYLVTLLEEEVINRETKAIVRALKQARFPAEKDLAGFDFSACPQVNKQAVLTLSLGEYIEKKENVIFLGSSGVGKSHLAIALGVEACRQRKRVRFYNASTLTYLLKEMDDQKQISRFEKQFLRYDLIICDELGYIPFSTTGAQLLFKFLSLRYERGSMIFTSNLDFARWDTLFHDSLMTQALLDRITHRAHIFSMEGESYRFKEAMRKEKRYE